MPSSGKSKVKALAHVVPWRVPVPGCRWLPSLWGLHVVDRKGGRAVVSFSFYKALIPPRGPTLLTLLNLITSQSPHLQTPSHWTLELQHMNLVGNKHPAHSSLSVTGRSDFSMLSHCFRLFPQLDWKLPEAQTVAGSNCVSMCLVITSTYLLQAPQKFTLKGPQTLPFLCPHGNFCV